MERKREEEKEALAISPPLCLPFSPRVTPST